MSGADSSPPTLPGWLRGALLLIILTGVVLRVALPGTTVFLNDQARACALAADIAAGRWETAGLINSAGTRNFPGFGYVLAAVWFLAPSPWALLYFINVVNLAALGLSAYLLRRWLSEPAALWGLAFFSAAPWAIQYCRWIWAQDLLFPCAVFVYWMLWRWVDRRSAWAALGVLLGLVALVQIHLAGVFVLAACLLVALWRRAPLRPAPLLLGLLAAVASFAPYFATQPLRTPDEQKRDYRQSWRLAPAAAMSVSGLVWNLEFKDGYADFARSLSWRRWPYEALMIVPFALLAAGLVLAVWQLAQAQRTASDADSAEAVPGTGRAVGRGAVEPAGSGLRLATALMLLIPLLFLASGVRVSPTYLPVWYPLPFVLIGLAAERLRHGVARLALLAVLGGQLLFFSEQLLYIHRHGGVPHSILDRSLGGLWADLKPVRDAVEPTCELWAVYEGPSDFMHEPTAFLLRHLVTELPHTTHGELASRTNSPLSRPPARLLHYRPWTADPLVLEPLPEAGPPPLAARILPRVGPWQIDCKIPVP